MTLNYTLTEEDYLNFNRYYLESSKDFKRMVLITRLIALAGMVLVFGMMLREVAEQPIFIVVIAVTELLLLAMGIFAKKLLMVATLRQVRKVLRKQNPEGFGEVTLTFDGKTIKTDSKKSTTEVPVKEIETIADKYDTVLLYISTASAFIIPHRAFESDTQREEFLAAIR